MPGSQLPPCAALTVHSSLNGRGSEHAWGGQAEEACPAAHVAQQLDSSPQGVHGRRQGGCSALSGARLQSKRTARSGRQLPPSAPLDPHASPWSSKLQHLVNLPTHWAGVSATERHTIRFDSQQDLERRRGACRRPSDAGGVAVGAHARRSVNCFQLAGPICTLLSFHLPHFTGSQGCRRYTRCCGRGWPCLAAAPAAAWRRPPGHQQCRSVNVSQCFHPAAAAAVCERALAGPLPGQTAAAAN